MRKWIVLMALGVGMTVQGFDVEQRSDRYLLPPLPPLPANQVEVAPGIQGTRPEVIQTKPQAIKAYDNQIDWVMAVDYATVEIRMAKALSPEELKPEAGEIIRQRFHFSDGVVAIGVPQPVAHEERLYRIPVNGLAGDHLYTVSYADSPEMTFRTDRTESETEARYKGRYGDHW